MATNQSASKSRRRSSGELTQRGQLVFPAPVHAENPVPSGAPTASDPFLLRLPRLAEDLSAVGFVHSSANVCLIRSGTNTSITYVYLLDN